MKSTTSVILPSLMLALLTSCECAQIPARYSYDSSSNIKRRSTEKEIAENSKPNQLHETINDEIPMEFYKELDNVTDVSDFIKRFAFNPDSIDPQLGIQENLRINVERAASIQAKPANCIPESTIVPLTPLNPSKDPKVIYYPKCTRVNRCGGCCSSELMSCQPVEKDFVNFEVTKYHYGDAQPITGKEIIVVEKHIKCRCGCRIKETDCNPYQQYHPELCRCVCTNDNSLQKCLTQDHKIWDDKDCRCVCRDSQTCTTGTIFDENQCKCININHVEYFD